MLHDFPNLRVARQPSENHERRENHNASCHESGAFCTAISLPSHPSAGQIIIFVECVKLPRGIWNVALEMSIRVKQVFRAHPMWGGLREPSQAVKLVFAPTATFTTRHFVFVNARPTELGS